MRQPFNLDQKLLDLGQSSLTQLLEDLSLSETDREGLLKQIEQIDHAKWARLQQARLEPIQPIQPPYYPFQPIPYASIDSHILEAGHRTIANGAVGCLVVAGGQGTRLGFDGPKGAYPLTPKSLFELLAERIAGLQQLYDRSLPLAMMTSPSNDQATQEFFQKKHLHRLIPQVEFFSQGMLPLLTQTGELFLTPSAQLAEGPDGNGAALSAFYHSGIWSRWKEQGVQSLLFIQIDNALADPYDAALVGLHHLNRQDISLKCVQRRDPEEPVGVLVAKEERIYVVEYSEMDAAERFAIDAQGELKYKYANISLFCFSMDFIQLIATEFSKAMPLHLAKKQAMALRMREGIRSIECLEALKGEYFIFDVLPLAQHVQVVDYPREICFAPLKNQTGKDSPEAVKQALRSQLPYLI